MRLRTWNNLLAACVALLLLCVAPRAALAHDPCAAGEEAQAELASDEGLALSSDELALAGAQANASSQSAVRRLSGATRYDTMSSIVSAGFSKASTVVIASGDNFPDSLSAASLAGKLGAPILLTSGGSLSEQAAAQITSLGAKRAVVLGGTAAVSNAVTDEVKQMGLSVQRIWGATRQATAAAVAREVGGGCATAIVASANAPWDSLSISSYSYANAIPVVLAQADGTLSSGDVSLLKSLGVKRVIIVGGTSAVAGSAESQLSGFSVERWWGQTRYETSKEIAEHVLKEGGSASYVALASGANYPDALASASFLGSRGGLVLLTAFGDDSAFEVLKQHASEGVSCYVLGGLAALPLEVEQGARKALGITSGGGSVEPIGKTVLVFVPHQDDELLSMGAAVSEYVALGYDVHVILCTDGSSSYVRTLLKDGKGCDLHSGMHAYSLTREEFSAARDAEFADSCLSLGVDEDNVHVAAARAVDGSLSEGVAEEIVSSYLEQYPDAEVWAPSPLAGADQHVDHRILGEAVRKLCEDGTVGAHKFFVEPYLLSSFVEGNPDVELTKVSAADEDLRIDIDGAAQSYCRWDPKNKRYAIGLHSVTGDFSSVLNDPPTSWCYA